MLVLQVGLSGLFGMLVFRRLFTKISDPDLWWHLSNGRYMLENRVFLRTDVFSHTLPNTPWINFEWLSQILLAALFHAAGYAGVFVAKILFGLGVVFLLGYLVYRSGGRGGLLFLSTVLGFLVVRPRLYERVELFTLLFLGVYTLLVLKGRESGPHALKKLPWLLAGLMVIWCNLHGGFIFGIGVVSLFLIGAYWRGEPRPYQRALFFSIIFILIAIMINPFGPRLLLVFVEHFQQMVMAPRMISEWMPSEVRLAPYFWILFVVSSALLVRGFLTGDREVLFWAPAVTVFLAFGAFFYRSAALAVFVCLPFLAGALRTLIDQVLPDSKTRTVDAFAWLLGAGLLVAQGPSFLPSWPKPLVNPISVPEKACAFIRERNIQGSLYNSYELGGYVAWSLGPERKIFMDGRYLFHPLAMEQSVLNAQLQKDVHHPGWKNYLERYGVVSAVVSREGFTIPAMVSRTPFHFRAYNAMFPRQDWALVFWDDAALVFLKRTPAQLAIISRQEYKTLWPYNLGQMYYLLMNDVFKITDVEKELARHKLEVGFSVLAKEIENLLEKVRVDRDQA